MTAETGKHATSMIQVPKSIISTGHDHRNLAVQNTLAKSEMLNSGQSANAPTGSCRASHRAIDQFMMQFAEHSFTGSANYCSEVRR